DWDVIEGRKEGDIRAQLAEKIRKLRKSGSGVETVDPVSEIRKRLNVKEYDGVKGDVVIGRHTWKEYMRGLHEGWLGPLEKPEPAPSLSAERPSPSTDAEPRSQAAGDVPAMNGQSTDDASPVAAQLEEPKADHQPP